MDIVEPPQVITAISDPEFEGLVSSALFAQGWSVVARTLDFQELQKSLVIKSNEKILVIFSTDLPGLNQADLEIMKRRDTKFFGFADEAGSARGLSDISIRPRSPEALLLSILENIRGVIGRTPLIHAPLKINAHVIAIGGVRHATGNTTFAINLAQELAELGSKTLLIDANFQSPALATLLDLRHLANEKKWREFSPLFSVMELTREKIDSYDELVAEAGEIFDEIVIDLGSVSYLASEISDRRWASKAKIWASHCADDFCLTSANDLLTQKSLDDFSENSHKLSLRSKFHLINIQSPPKIKIDRKFGEKSLFAPLNSWSLPWDQRGCQSAVAERTTLVCIGERGPLRREIAAVAKSLRLKK